MIIAANDLDDRRGTLLAHAQTNRSSIAARILDYLLERPTAADTARCIAEWWIGNGTIGDIAAVEAALESLAAKNLVQVKTLADGTQIWSAGANLRAAKSKPSSNR